jgi:gamma-glutamyltranspeptidase/glutathione hydrolase
LAGKVFMGSEVAATEDPRASQAAVESLRAGGNAFDAAASASFVLSVVQPHLSGLGGDFFGLFFEASTGRVRCLNASGWAPSSFSLQSDRFRGGVPTFGHASVVVPGYVAGVHEMQRRFGRLAFSDSLRTAIELADGGFPAGPGLVRSLARFADSLSPAAKSTFFKHGDVPAVGSIVRQRQLAATLREVSESGAEGFYRGSAAEAARAEMAAAGFEVSEEDLSAYSPEWCEPLRMDYGGTDIFEVPPNSMGATTLLILRLLQSQDLTSLKPDSAERVKVMVEAAKVAYAARDEKLGDPRFSDFDLEGFLRSAPAGGRIDKADTTNFAVADKEGNVLSCIQSVFHNFGSRVFVEGGGFFLNNRGSGFRTKGPNRLEPRKRPLHTLSALILSKDGKPYAAMGASGGEYRPQQHALLVTNVVDYGMEVDEAIDFPRFLWDGTEVGFEEGYNGVSDLRLLTRTLRYPGPTGVAQGVQLMPEAVKGVCDIRGEGLPAGR